MLNPVIACSRCPHSARRCVGRCACTLDGKDITCHQKHAYCPDGRFGAGAKPAGWDAIEKAPPSPPQPIRGLGDVVARITSAVGIPPCGGCKDRQEALNRAVPFKQ